jgi:hypothetical protein
VDAGGAPRPNPDIPLIPPINIRIIPSRDLGVACWLSGYGVRQALEQMDALYHAHLTRPTELVRHAIEALRVEGFACRLSGWHSSALVLCELLQDHLR